MSLDALQADAAYPTTTPPDPVHPGQTRAPLGAPLNDVATPAIWARLRSPLERALVELWTCAGLGDRARPAQWVGFHYGRIALNAHGWERLCALREGREPDPALVEPAHGRWGRASERIERVRVRQLRKRYQRRIQRAEEQRQVALERAGALEVADIDIAALARGPLDDARWAEVLLPWLAGDSGKGADRAVRAGLALEQRCGAELGARLAARGVLDEPAQVAYLTIAERLRAVHEGPGPWAGLARTRLARAEHFATIELPELFWGRPRVDDEKEEARVL